MGGAGPPADGDDFTISNGHTVTYNVGLSQTNGFADSNIYGHLVHEAGTTQLKMNGNLNVRTNGLYEMVDNSTLIFKGTNSDDHGLNVRAEAGASFLATGSSPTQETKLSASGMLEMHILVLIVQLILHQVTGVVFIIDIMI